MHADIARPSLVKLRLYNPGGFSFSAGHSLTSTAGEIAPTHAAVCESCSEMTAELKKKGAFCSIYAV